MTHKAAIASRMEAQMYVVTYRLFYKIFSFDLQKVAGLNVI